VARTRWWRANTTSQAAASCTAASPGAQSASLKALAARATSSNGASALSRAGRAGRVSGWLAGWLVGWRRSNHRRERTLGHGEQLEGLERGLRCGGAARGARREQLQQLPPAAGGARGLAQCAHGVQSGAACQGVHPGRGLARVRVLHEPREGHDCRLGHVGPREGLGEDPTEPHAGQLGAEAGARREAHNLEQRRAHARPHQRQAV
jgi:hypothetical protein